MGRTVLLLHELPDGGSHYDWLMERAGVGAQPTAGLLSFRVTERIDLSGRVGGFRAVRIADHRRAYLDYEGDVSGGRGRVRRVAEGEIVIVAEELGIIRLRGRLGEASGEFIGEISGAEWVFRFIAG